MTLRSITTQVAKLAPLERRSPGSIAIRQSVEALEMLYCDNLIQAIAEIKNNQTLRRLLYASHLLSRMDSIGRLVDNGVNSIQARKDNS